MRKLALIVCTAILAACAGNDVMSGVDLCNRENQLLETGMIYYGEDPDEEPFADMYYAFMADEYEKEQASAKALRDFQMQVAGMTAKERKFLGAVFSDFADLADMSSYVYKDGPAEIPHGWTDLGMQDPKIARIINKYAVSGGMPTGLKCSLMGKGGRRLLVFAGTDFPSDWDDMDQVTDFLIDAYEDISGALFKDASQVVLAGKLVDELIAGGYVNSSNLEFAGHSLGGRLASEMSVKYGCPAVLFNAAGVSPEIYTQYEITRQEASRRWRGYVVDVVAANDPLTCAQRYMSGITDPFVSSAAKAMSVDKTSMESLFSLGRGLLGAVVDNLAETSEVMAAVKGVTQAVGVVVDELYCRDYRALGAMMPIREDMGGHGIEELAAALRVRAQICR